MLACSALSSPSMGCFPAGASVSRFADSDQFLIACSQFPKHWSERALRNLAGCDLQTSACVVSLSWLGARFPVKEMGEQLKALPGLRMHPWDWYTQEPAKQLERPRKQKRAVSD